MSKKVFLLRSFVFLLLAFGSPDSALAQDIQARSVRWGHLNNSDHPVSKGVQKFIQIVETKSDGKIKVREYPSSQLGPEMQQQSALRAGMQEMMSASTTSLVSIVKEFGLIDFPFIVSTPEQADSLLDGPVGKALLDKLPAQGLVGLAYWDLGFRNITNSRRPITKDEDLTGMSIRVIPNPVYIETFRAFHANAVPVSFPELYAALANRAVDGQENPYSVILSNRFYEVQKFLSITNHTYGAIIILVSKRFWDKLSSAEQNILQEAAIEARDFQRKVSREHEQEALDALKTRGMQVNALTPSELDHMREEAKPVAQKFFREYDPGTVKLFNDELDRIHGQKK